MVKTNDSINKLTHHKFYECSELPFLGCLGIFSCSACDRWRQRIYSRGFGQALPRRDFLNDRYQCSRSKRGLGPIRVRVVYNGDSSPSERLPSGIDNLSEDKENTNVNVVSTDKVLEKTKCAKEVISRLESSKRAREAKEIQSRLNNQTSVPSRYY
jgi:hypothetical protein